jgi:DNA polymerase III delta prime subunit
MVEPNKIPLAILSGTIGVSSLYFYKKYVEHAQKSIQCNLQTLSLYNYQEKFEDVSNYIYDKYQGQIQDFHYTEETIYSFTEWRNRRKEKPKKMRNLCPQQCSISVEHEYKGNEYPIQIHMGLLKDDEGNGIKVMREGCHSSEEIFVTELTLRAESKDILVDFVDKGVKHMKDKKKECQDSGKDTMCIYYYRSEFWTLLSKTPKRSSDTIYLKKGVKDTMMNKVKDFFSEDTRDIYVKYGIPYKSVCLIHGPPGTGKTSLIKSISSELDCDLYVLPITKTMLDTNFIDAFTYINDTSDKNRIIVIEDIDTMFEERKVGDKDNGITMQGFLNCMDGFTCMEGTMLFLTANKPEVLDNAMIRSCRIDHKLELGYADKYQTQQMFEVFLPDQTDKFPEFYKFIEHKEYTTAMLQEFLFYNRAEPDILEVKEKINGIMDKNSTKYFEVVKEETHNCYM